MRNKLFIGITASVLMLNGCTGLHDDVSPTVARTKTTLQLCATYGSYKQYAHKLSNIRNELIRRNEFSAREWELINSNRIAVGMSSEALTCSWGYPNDINRASYGNQAVYGTGIKRSYVYTENGRVTAWN